MKKVTYDKALTAFFVGFICVIMALSFVLNPKLILGGFYRGFKESPDDATLNEKIKSAIHKTDSGINDTCVIHDLSINLYGGAQLLMEKNFVSDTDKDYEVVKLSNGYLCFKNNQDSDYESFGGYIEKFSETCKDFGADFILVNTPNKDYDNAQYTDSVYPYNYKNNMPQVFANLTEKGINVLDFEAYCKENDVDKYSLFYKTDHHWHTKGGLWASNAVAQRLNSDFGYDLNVPDFSEEVYNIEHYEESFLGSQGRRVGVFFGGIDDFDIIIPKNSCTYTLEVPSQNRLLEGDFEAVFINRDIFAKDGLLSISSTSYQTYMRENCDLVKITNHSMQSGKKALMVMDSYGLVMAPFLSQSFSELHCIDIREYTDPLEDYVEEYSPDVVIYAVKDFQK